MSECERCGKCCVEYIGTFGATKEDILRWRKEGRDDILAYVCFMGDDWGDLFFHPETGEEIHDRCPFLRKIRNKNEYECMIEETKSDFNEDTLMKWEYKTIKVDTTGFTGGKFDQNSFEQILNGLGQQGWELTSAFDTNQEMGASRHVIAILKRPIE